MTSTLYKSMHDTHYHLFALYLSSIGTYHLPTIYLPLNSTYRLPTEQDVNLTPKLRALLIDCTVR